LFYRTKALGIIHWIKVFCFSIKSGFAEI
jgi:hypothetical protein